MKWTFRSICLHILKGHLTCKYIEHRYSAKDVTKHVFAIVSAKCFQIRTHSVLYEADNVLTPAVIQVLHYSENFSFAHFCDNAH